MNIHSGSCRCGGVSIEASGNANFKGYCHCDDCRRSNGAPVVSFVAFTCKQFDWKTKQSLAEWRNGDFGRLFCKSCGSPVAYTDDHYPEVVFFYIGFMTKPSIFAPENHSFHSSKLSWLKLVDELPKSNQTSYPYPD